MEDIKNFLQAKKEEENDCDNETERKIISEVIKSKTKPGTVDKEEKPSENAEDKQEEKPSGQVHEKESKATRQVQDKQEEKAPVKDKSNTIPKQLQEKEVKASVLPINLNQINKSILNNSKPVNENKVSELLNKLTRMVRPISDLMNKGIWSVQPEKTNKLQHQCDSHRSYLFDHNLVCFNEKANRIECRIDRIPNVNYFKFIKVTDDLTNKFVELCECDDYEKIQRCEHCSGLREGIASRSIGKKYDSMDLPKWNLTFTAGALRSNSRVFHGTYKTRFKTRLNNGCQSFITFSMMLPIKDPVYPNTGYWEEIALGFSQEKSKALSLFLKSDLSNENDPATKKQIVIPISVSDPDFTHKEYNNYTLHWKEESIKLFINGKCLYRTEKGHPVPKLPGYTYFIIRPNYNTRSVALIKNIKRNEGPNFCIKSFTYTKA